MLLDFYLISTALSCIITTFISYTLDKRMKREGLKDTEDNLSIPEKIMKELQMDAFLLVPILNIIFSLYAFFNFDKVYDEAMNKSLKEGKVIRTNKSLKNSDRKKNFKEKAVANIPFHDNKQELDVTSDVVSKDEVILYLKSLKKGILEASKDEKEKGIQKKKVFKRN